MEPVIRSLDPAELAHIPEMDVSDESETIYVQDGERLERRPLPHLQLPRSAAGWSEEIGEWQGYVRDRGFAFGAFADGRLVGVAILRMGLTEGTDQLAGLYVDRSWRRNGVARSLLEKVLEMSSAGGATSLYVSATRSESAVGFYRSFGFSPTARPHPELLEREPHDIHMTLELPGPI
jgi:GNAT superfamily N-acetyltransferase